MHEGKPLAQRHAEMIHEFEGSCASASLLAIDDDEIGRNASFPHGLDHGEELPRMADAELEADRLAAGERAQTCDELHHLEWRGEGRMPRRRDAVLSHRHPTDLGDLFGHFRRWQDAAM